MIDDEKFGKIDKRIIYAFLSSQTFLENTDFNSVSIEELLIIKKL